MEVESFWYVCCRHKVDCKALEIGFAHNLVGIASWHFKSFFGATRHSALCTPSRWGGTACCVLSRLLQQRLSTKPVGKRRRRQKAGVFAGIPTNFLPECKVNKAKSGRNNNKKQKVPKQRRKRPGPGPGRRDRKVSHRRRKRNEIFFCSIWFNPQKETCRCHRRHSVCSNLNLNLDEDKAEDEDSVLALLRRKGWELRAESWPRTPSRWDRISGICARLCVLVCWWSHDQVSQESWRLEIWFWQSFRGFPASFFVFLCVFFFFKLACLCFLFVLCVRFRNLFSILFVHFLVTKHVSHISNSSLSLLASALKQF